MRIVDVVSAVLIAFMLASAQMLLKMGVTESQQAVGRANSVSFFIEVGCSWQFWASMGLLAFVVPAWIWLLSAVPISKAYPFLFLAVVFVSIMEQVLLGTPLSMRYYLGCALIFGGLVLALSA